MQLLCVAGHTAVGRPVTIRGARHMMSGFGEEPAVERCLTE